MKKSIFNFALALLVFGASIASVSAFWGGGQMMTADKFAEFKAIVSQSSDFESFQKSMETIREQHKAEMESMQEKITRSVENIENGIVQTVTSDDADIVAKIQTQHSNMPQRGNDKISRIVENITNGVKITITSDDADMVEHLQNRSEKGMGRMDKMGGRFGKAGIDKPENWTEMTSEEKQTFMQDNGMGREQMNGEGKQRQHPALRGKRRGGMGENMNGQRKETLKERFQNWMGQ